MEGTKGRDERNKLRQVMMKAEEEKLMSRSEAGFVVAIVERFRQEIEKKQRILSTLQGELSQLMANEKIIVDLVENILRAAERDRARRETMARIKGQKLDEDQPEVNVEGNTEEASE